MRYLPMDTICHYVPQLQPGPVSNTPYIEQIPEDDHLIQPLPSSSVVLSFRPPVEKPEAPVGAQEPAYTELL